MKRNGLLILTALASVLVTGFVLPRSEWLGSRTPPVVEVRGRGRDGVSAEAAWRWQQGPPSHWRACLLQH